MHLYQASLEGHESRVEAQWARVPTLCLGQNGRPGAKKNHPSLLSSCHLLTMIMYMLLVKKSRTFNEQKQYFKHFQDLKIRVLKFKGFQDVYKPCLKKKKHLQPY